MEQAAQLAGAILIVIAFTLSQMEKLRNDSLAYLLLNLIGSSILLVVAWLGQNWGFLLLQVVWIAVSLVGLVKLGRAS
ncbi:MAG: hypothetical protein WAO58_03275 [Fimbriimonadaceae bacterium]